LHALCETPHHGRTPEKLQQSAPRSPGLRHAHHERMTQHTRAPDNPDDTGTSSAFGPLALHEWNRHVESILRGMAHALNNRAAALSAVAELSHQAQEDPAQITAILSTELDRVKTLTQIVRAVGAPRMGSEAFSPSDAVREAMAVLEMHASLRDHPAVIDEATATPTRVPKWMFVRSLIALAASASEQCGTAARLDVIDDGDWIVTRVHGVSRDCADVSPYAAELAVAMRGEVLLERNGFCGFRVPTLAAIRRREAR
jgi:hypothetical protein